MTTSELQEDSECSEADVEIESSADLDQLEFALNTLVNFSKKGKEQTSSRDAFEEFEKAAETQSQFQSVNPKPQTFKRKKTIRFGFDELPTIEKPTHSIKKMGKDKWIYSYQPSPRNVKPGEVQKETDA